MFVSREIVFMLSHCIIQTALVFWTINTISVTWDKMSIRMSEKTLYVRRLWHKKQQLLNYFFLIKKIKIDQRKRTSCITGKSFCMHHICTKRSDYFHDAWTRIYTYNIHASRARVFVRLKRKWNKLDFYVFNSFSRTICGT